MMKIDSATGQAVGPVTEVFPSGSYPRSGGGSQPPTFGRHIDLQQGPDGALYLLNHGAGCCNGNHNGSSYMGIIRISYTGTCSEPNLSPVVSAKPRARRGDAWLRVRAGALSVRSRGPHAIRILDVSGRELHAFRGAGPKDYTLPVLAPGGVYLLRAESPDGALTRLLGRP